jgi:hypothetical protein
MKWLILILIALPTAVPPLSETQRIALEDTDDLSSTIDAAGLYALLENVEQWSPVPTELEPGQRLIDFAALRTSPESARGEAWVLEGALESVANAALYTPNRLLTRPSWKDLTVWHIRGPNDEIYLVCLTDPPAVAIANTVNEHAIPAADTPPVRVLGRFYKLIAVANQDDQAMRYAVFVGKTARFLDMPARQASGTGSTNPLVGPGVLLAVLLVGAYVLIRVTLKRKAKPVRRRRQESEEDDEPVEYRTDLPADPAAALDALEHEHETNDRDR